MSVIAVRAEGDWADEDSPAVLVEVDVDAVATGCTVGHLFVVGPDSLPTALGGTAVGKGFDDDDDDEEGTDTLGRAALCPCPSASPLATKSDMTRSCTFFR